MKRSILLSVLVIGAVAALVGAGSWAQFNDTETSDNNTIATGDLNLLVGITTDGVCDTEYVDPWTGPLINVSDAAPGDTGEVTICVKNDGSIDGTLDADVYNVTDTEIGCNEPEQDAESSSTCTDPDGELSENLLVEVWADWDCDNQMDTGETVFFSGDADALEGFDFPSTPGDMPAGSETCIGVAWTVDSNAGNEIQTDQVTADVDFILEQAP